MRHENGKETWRMAEKDMHTKKEVITLCEIKAGSI